MSCPINLNENWRLGPIDHRFAASHQKIRPLNCSLNLSSSLPPSSTVSLSKHKFRLLCGCLAIYGFCTRFPSFFLFLLFLGLFNWFLSFQPRGGVRHNKQRRERWSSRCNLARVTLIWKCCRVLRKVRSSPRICRAVVPGTENSFKTTRLKLISKTTKGNQLTTGSFLDGTKSGESWLVYLPFNKMLQLRRVGFIYFQVEKYGKKYKLLETKKIVPTKK